MRGDAIAMDRLREWVKSDMDRKFDIAVVWGCTSQSPMALEWWVELRGDGDEPHDVNLHRPTLAEAVEEALRDWEYNNVSKAKL